MKLYEITMLRNELIISRACPTDVKIPSAMMTKNPVSVHVILGLTFCEQLLGIENEK